MTWFKPAKEAIKDVKKRQQGTLSDRERSRRFLKGLGDGASMAAIKQLYKNDPDYQAGYSRGQELRKTEGTAYEVREGLKPAWITLYPQEG